MRKLAAMVRGLPDDGPRVRSLLQHKVIKDPPWSVTDHLIANVYNAIGEAARMIAKSNGAKRVPKLKPHPRPGQQAGKRIGDATQLPQLEIIKRLRIMRGEGTPEQTAALAALPVGKE